MLCQVRTKLFAGCLTLVVAGIALSADDAFGQRDRGIVELPDSELEPRERPLRERRPAAEDRLERLELQVQELREQGRQDAAEQLEKRPLGSCTAR